jgi:Zn finger protein HypA/HybF involved in hydrogenase expression
MSAPEDAPRCADCNRPLPKDWWSDLCPRCLDREAEDNRR